MKIKIKRESATFLVLLGVIGVLFMFLGAVYESSEKKHIWGANACAAIGGAILGTGLSLLMSRIFEPSQMEEIHQLLSITKNSPLIVEDAKLSATRELYHGYLYSHALGKPQWKYRVFDFREEKRPGYLHAKVNVWVPTDDNKDKQYSGKSHSHDGLSHRPGDQVYLYDGFLCGQDHLLLTGKLDKGGEPEVIQVFPFVFNRVAGNRVLAGLAFLETSDSKHIVTPTILSREPLTDDTEFGPVKKAGDAVVLMERWQKDFFATMMDQIPKGKS